MAPQKMNELIIGTQYYRAPLPERTEWDRDIKNIKKIGMNTVKLFPQWRWHERVKGNFYWDDMDRLFDLCEKNRLFVYVNIILDVAPDWLFRGGRGIRVSNKGIVKQPAADGCRYIGGWEPCFDDPVVRKEAARFLRAIIERYRDRRFLNVWDIWNEPRSRDGDCACEESRKNYREWLRRKYNTIEKLNEFWGKAWSSFDDINPPALLGDYAEMYLWRQWAMDSVADRIAWAYKIARLLDSKHPVITHVGGCSVMQNVLYDTCDDWLVSREVDSYGSSLAVYSNEAPFISRTLSGLHCDWIRNLSEDFWISEFYPNLDGWKKSITPEDIRLRLWSLLAHGAKKILFWQYRAERVGNESNGHGLVEINGESNERTTEVEKILKAVERNREILRTFKVRAAEVALIYSQKSDLISHIESIEGDNFTSMGTYTSRGRNYKVSLSGSYALFWENNIPVDIISIHEIKRIRSYKVVYLPIPYVVDEATANELIEFVHSGGILISEASIGLRAENTWLNTTNPNERLRQLFGAKEKCRMAIDKPCHVHIPSFNIRIPATRLITQIEREGSKSHGFWDDENDAITINHYGRGKAVLLGFYAGASYIDTADTRLIRFISLLMKKMGVYSPVKIKGTRGGIQVRLLQEKDKILVILFNYEDKDKQFELIVPRTSQFTSLCNISKLEKTESGVRVFLPAGEVSLILYKNRRGKTK